MPFEEQNVVGCRMQFVSAWLGEEQTKSELCRLFGITRPTGDRWIRRFLEEGVAGLEDRSSAAHQHPNELVAQHERWILQLRDKHPTWGPKKLVAAIEAREGLAHLCAPSTAGELLRRQGLTHPRQCRRHVVVSTEKLGSYESANAVWCIDFKGWFRMGNGRRCDPLTITDGYSRFLLRCQALPRTDLESTRRVLDAAFREYGLPARLRSDNGAPFGSVAIGGLSALAVWLLKLGVQPERIEPAKPYQNGRHERMHLTLNEAIQPPAYDLRAQQRRFDAFRRCFNHERPHEALAQRTPASAYEISAHAYRGVVPEVRYPDGVMTRRVQQRGEFNWASETVFLSESLRGETVALEPAGRGRWAVRFMHRVLGTFDEKTLRMLPKEKAGQKRRRPQSKRKK
jgi:putative transposase